MWPTRAGRAPGANRPDEGGAIDYNWASREAHHRVSSFPVAGSLRRFTGERSFDEVGPTFLFAHGSTMTNIGYPALAALVFGESAGLPIPGETALIGASLLARHGTMNLALVILITTLASTLGDNLGYWIGRRGGRKVLLARRGPFLHHRQKALFKSELFFAKYGVRAVFLGRWVPGVRVAAALVAGATRMPVGGFMVANALGALAWAATTALIVYWLGIIGGTIMVANGAMIAAVTAVVGLAKRQRAKSRAGDAATEQV